MKVKVKGYQRTKPKVRQQGFAKGGLVQERIDSGIGPNWTNSVGYADPSAQYASEKADMAKKFEHMRGPKLQNAMKREADGLANLDNLKARAANWEQTGLAPWEQPRQSVASFAPRDKEIGRAHV
jgi:hypothetical protein